LSYPSAPALVVNVAMTALTPTVTGTVVGYVVSPSLPAGLALDASSGVAATDALIAAVQCRGTAPIALAGTSAVVVGANELSVLAAADGHVLGTITAPYTRSTNGSPTAPASRPRCPPRYIPTPRPACSRI
jgi:hypothetical protein